MKKIITILTIIVPILLFGQGTKEIIVKFPNSKQIRERFSVLNSNENIKNGEYTKYYKLSKKNIGKEFIHTKGHYKNGEKDGIWEYFDNPFHGSQGNFLTKEIYKNGFKTGIWENHIYDSGDHIILKYDYDNNTELEPDILISLKYPPLAHELGIEGDVIVKYRIKTDCVIDDIEIVKSLSPECDNEVIRQFTRLSEFQKKYGVKKKCEEKETTATIHFNLKE